MPKCVNEQAHLFLQIQWTLEQIASKLPISHKTIYLRVYADKAQVSSLKEMALPEAKEEVVCGWTGPSRANTQ